MTNGGKVVVRYADGRLVKGYSYDFAPGRPRFHVFSARDASAEPTPIVLGDLKAVFFVRDFAGKVTYRERKSFAEGYRPPGHAIEVRFHDGEVLVGSTTGDVHVEPGVLFTPADPASNNIRVYAVSAAIRQVRVLAATQPPAPPAPRPRQPPSLPRGVRAWLVRQHRRASV